MSGEVWQDHQSLHQRTPCDKRSASKRILSPNSNRWQGLDGHHQWKMAKALFCLEKRNFVVDHLFSIICLCLPFLFDLFFFIPPSDYVTRKVVTCFHECAMKKYEILASCYGSSKKKRRNSQV